MSQPGIHGNNQTFQLVSQPCKLANPDATSQPSNDGNRYVLQGVTHAKDVTHMVCYVMLYVFIFLMYVCILAGKRRVNTYLRMIHLYVVG
jgi:hypothetical protein